jgi:hypothetical protein
MLYFDKQGNSNVSKNILKHENPDHFDNPIFEKVYRQYFFERTPDIKKKGANLVAYNDFMGDRDNL